MTNAPEYHSISDAYAQGLENGKALSDADHAATVAELRAESVRIERENLEGWKQAAHHRQRADAAERRVWELIEIISRVARCSYSVCTQIDLRGRRWSEAYLDQVLPDILATLTGADPT